MPDSFTELTVFTVEQVMYLSLSYPNPYSATSVLTNLTFDLNIPYSNLWLGDRA